MRFKEYLVFTKKERIGVLALITLVLLIFLLPERLLSLQENGAAPGITGEAEEVLEARQVRINDHAAVDPAAAGELTGPGLRKPDLQKRRGYDRTYRKGGATAAAYGYRESGEKMEGRGKKTDGWAGRRTDLQGERIRSSERRFVPVDLNSADTLQLIALPGIGSRLANRIVLFRERLGGFYSVTQLSEVYGLPDTVFRMLAPRLRCSGVVTKLDINTAEKEVLGRHPYIRWQLAGVLVSYRDQHGQFRSMDDLKKIHRLDSAVLRKIEPYLRFQ